MREDHNTREDRLDLLIKYMKLEMEDVHIKPQDCLAKMRNKKNESIVAGHYMNDETFLTYSLISSHQEKYQTTIFHTKRQAQNWSTDN